MTTDVLADDEDFASRVAPRRAVHGAGRRVERLMRIQRRDRRADRRRRGQARRASRLRAFGRCSKVLDAAEAAAGAPRDGAAAREMGVQAFAGQRHVDARRVILDARSMARISSKRSTIPSVSEKPAAKSSRSAGVPIITAKACAAIGDLDRRLDGHD